MKHFTFDKQTGIVLMISEGQNHFDDPNWGDLVLPIEEAKLIEDEFYLGNRKMIVKDGKVVVKQNRISLEKEVKKDKIKKAKNLDEIKDILLDLLS